jgi:hypothetical protein
MTAVIAKLLLDTLIIVLLALTISYCWLLNRRIKILQDSKSELAQLLKYFDESTTRASESILALQSASKKIGDNIQTRIEKANYALDDLSFMIEKASKLADQLEASFAVSRARTRAAEHAPQKEQKEAAAAPQPAKPSEPTLVASRPEAPSLSSRERTTTSLGAVLEKISGRVNGSNGQASDAPPAGASRSKAEQELLDLIRSGMKG